MSYVYLVATPVLNKALKNPQSSSINLFVELPTTAHCHMCYIHPDVTAEVFLNRIDNLPKNAKKPELKGI